MSCFPALLLDMGTDIHGWVEVHPRWINQEDAWLPLLNESLLLNRDYADFARLFNVCNSEKLDTLASHRGFPTLISSAVQREVEAGPKPEGERYLDGYFSCHSASWATWDELKSVDWSEFNESFQTLRKLIEVLAQSRDCNQIRLVVWFDS